MAQKFVVSEKIVKMREFLKQSLRYFISVLSTLQIKLREKKGGEGAVLRCPPVPLGYATGDDYDKLKTTFECF